MSNARDKANIPALNFSSTGIDDNATSTAITIDSGEQVGIGTTSLGTYQLSVDSGTAGNTNSEAGIFAQGIRSGVVYNFVSNNTSVATGRGTGIKFQSGGFDLGAIITRSDVTAASGDAPGYMTFHTSSDNTEDLSERMRIDSSGNVGIGTSSPDFPLEIYKTSTSEVAIGSDNGGTAQLSFYENNSTAKEFFVKYDGLNNNGVIGTSAVSNAIVIPRDSGNVGIGTSSPEGKLHINDGTNKNLLIKGSDSGDITEILNFSTSNGYRNLLLGGSVLRFETGAGGGSSTTERMRITSDGKVGIGTSSPDVKLQVQGSSALGSGTGTTNAIRIHDTSAGSSWSTTQDFNQLQFSSGDTSNPAGSGVRYSIGVVAHDSANTYSNLTFRNYDGTEHMRINGAYGKIGINTSSPSGTFRTTIQEDETGHGCLVLDRTSNIDSTLRSMVSFERSGTVVGTITVNNTSTSYNTSSDYRLKENVVDMTNATDRLKQLQPKRFNFIANADTTVDGFLAHEVSSVVPEAISGTHNEVDDDGNPIYQGIDQSKLVPLLVKTIQELEARITALETNQP